MILVSDSTSALSQPERACTRFPVIATRSLGRRFLPLQPLCTGIWSVHLLLDSPAGRRAGRVVVVLRLMFLGHGGLLAVGRVHGSDTVGSVCVAVAIGGQTEDCAVGAGCSLACQFHLSHIGFANESRIGAFFFLGFLLVGWGVARGRVARFVMVQGVVQVVALVLGRMRVTRAGVRGLVMGWCLMGWCLLGRLLSAWVWVFGGWLLMACWLLGVLLVSFSMFLRGLLALVVAHQFAHCVLCGFHLACSRCASLTLL